MKLNRFQGQPWSPAKMTEPLTENFLTAGPRLIALLERHFRLQDGQLIRLDEWQKALINHLLECYPKDWKDARHAGRLRYRQAVVSVARQNGKSLLGAAFALWGLLQHVPGASVVGLATSVDQANVVYNRVRYAVDNDPALTRLLKATGTRGIARRDGKGSYAVKPNLSEGLQSVPITLAIIDELHLLPRVVWDSIVQGQRAQSDALVLGITTAGDDDSQLLKRLYETGDKAIAGGRERFGFFCWQADEGTDIYTPGAMEAASPGIACGRIDLETARSDIADQPITEQKRYGLNQFVHQLDPWFPIQDWRQAAQVDLQLDTTNRVYFGISKTPSWGHASIAAAVKTSDQITTSLVATITDPNIDKLAQICHQLADLYDAAFIMDSANLSALGKQLRADGHETFILTQNEMAQASAATFAAIKQQRLTHDANPLVERQWLTAKRTSSGESWRISGRGADADAVLATIEAVFIAETKTDTEGPQMWV